MGFDPPPPPNFSSSSALLCRANFAKLIGTYPCTDPLGLAWLLERIILASYTQFEIALGPAAKGRLRYNRRGREPWTPSLPDDSGCCCDPLRAGLSGDPGTSLFILQRLCGTACRLISAVLWCGDLGVGANCLVRTKLRGSVRSAQRFNSQRCWPCSQHRDKCVGDVAGWLNAKAWGSTVVLVLLLVGVFMNSHSVCLMSKVSCARLVLISCTVC